MSAPLISDATLATIVRIITLDNEALPDVSSGDCMRVLRAVTQDKHADALDWARRDGFSAGLIRAIDEANEEAAVTYNQRFAEDCTAYPGEPSGAVAGKITMTGEALMHDGTRLDLSDPAAVKRAIDAQIASDPVLSRALETANSGEWITSDGQKIVDDIEAMLDAAPMGDIITNVDTALALMSAAVQRLTRERDEARAELAALKRGVA